MTMLFAINIGHTNAATDLTDFSYHDDLVPSLELSWEMKTFSVIEYACPEDFIWEINAGENMTQGDIFKIKFIDDPDNVTLTHFDDLFTTTHPWAEFRLNSDYLGDDASEIYFSEITPNIQHFPIVFVYPEEVLSNGTVMNTFDYLYEHLSPYEFDIGGASYKLINNADVFAIETKVKVKIQLFFGTVDINEQATVIYNKQLGVLSSYELHFTMKGSGDDASADIFLEITDESLRVKVNFEWVAGIYVLFIAGVVILRRRKRTR